MLSIENLKFFHCGPVNLTLSSGQCVGVSGESGTGKSLLLRSIADLDEHQGQCRLDEVSAQSMPANEWRRQVALLPADSQWWFDTVGEHFTEMDPVLLGKLGFPAEVKNWSIRRMSSGEKQRLALLRVLQNQPRVLLLDEPTANLDKRNSAIFEQVVAEYLEQHQACAFWVSHDHGQLDRVADVQFDLKDGRLLEKTSDMTALN
ncbi:MAG: ABC transporter ATP-binding protein [Gammaproteobacteria bacterium]